MLCYQVQKKLSCIVQGQQCDNTGGLRLLGLDLRRSVKILDEC